MILNLITIHQRILEQIKKIILINNKNKIDTEVITDKYIYSISK